jgi:hypothetical protein
MRLVAALAAVALLLPGSATAVAKERKTPEAKLADLLEGRVAGEPVDCIPLHQIRSTRIIDRTAIVWEAGSTVYVNRPAGAQSLDQWDVLVTKPFGSRLCSIDSVRLVDSGTRMTSGFVHLGAFVPYKKIRTAAN